MSSDRRPISRTSPSSLFDAIRNFLEEQKSIIRSIGFGTILEINFDEIPTALSFHVINEYTFGNINITKERIHNILGVPNGGKEIDFKKRRLRNDSVVKQWKQQYEAKSASGTNPRSVLKKMKQKKDLSSNKDDILLFLHYMDSKSESRKGLKWTTKELRKESELIEKGVEGEESNEKGVKGEKKLKKQKTTEKGVEGEESNEKGVKGEKKLKKRKTIEEVEGENKPKKQKTREKDMVKLLESAYSMFEKQFLLCSQRCPQNETYIAIKEKMQTHAAEPSTEDLAEALLSLKGTWNGDTMHVGPFRVRTENAPSAEDTRLLEWENWNSWERIATKRSSCCKNVQSIKLDEHYFLIVVNIPEEKVEVWDTLKGPLSEYNEYLGNVVTFLDSYTKPKSSFSRYTKKVADIKKQEADSNDCGIYLCYYLEFPDDVHKFQKEEMTNTSFNDDEKLQDLQYMINLLLLPVLKDMRAEQEKEIEMEATTQGNYSSYKTLLKPLDSNNVSGHFALDFRFGFKQWCSY
ncbi:hypothetical protein L2E82_18134 [Cichorium intybus]|uniref:Uncharacterized protein n=1 Tax=Cichorium intybus TaxID=13427 RepID=A0ACB9F9V8_CICIN|nr:hypothetical protein L2E82_18134 [Cichorium intybus]